MGFIQRKLREKKKEEISYSKKKKNISINYLDLRFKPQNLVLRIVNSYLQKYNTLCYSKVLSEIYKVQFWSIKYNTLNQL